VFREEDTLQIPNIILSVDGKDPGR